MNLRSWNFVNRYLVPVVPMFALATSGCGASRPTAAALKTVAQVAVTEATVAAAVNFVKDGDTSGRSARIARRSRARSPRGRRRSPAIRLTGRRGRS